MLHDFAQQLQRERETIVSRWLTAVRADEKLTTANKLSEPELRDHLGSLVVDLAQTLTTNQQMTGMTDDPKLAPGSRQDARAHGHARWAQDYGVDEVVREIAVIRSELLEIFSEYLKSTRQIETEEFLQTTQLLHRFFDEICLTSVTWYVQEREQHSERTQRGLRMLNEAMTKQYELADVSRRRTLSTVAHEMATPVNALGLGVTYLAESENPAERREAKQIISRTLDHLRTMLDQLLDFAKVDGGSEKLRLATFEMQPVFDYLVSNSEPMALAKELDFQSELDPTLVSVHSDENKVQRIAINLLSNAVKYTDSGSVSLAVRGVSETHWCIEVKDTGCGIPNEDAARIFAEFQRLPTHDDKPGLGLGLAIVRGLVERLGGEVKVKSVLGEGSCFTVVLPRKI